jgi:hypothetical protein
VNSILQRIEHAFGESMGVDEVEGLLLSASPRQDAARSWVLDLSKLRIVEPGAGYRFANALSRWAKGEVVVRVPPPKNYTGMWFRTFTRSGIGLALARHATVVHAGDEDITTQLRVYYASKEDTSSTNYGVRTRLHNGAFTPDIDRFAAEFFSLAGHIQLRPRDLRWSDRIALIALVFESVLNVVDHAFADPWQGDEPGLSYLSLRYYRTLSAKRDEQVGLSDYLTRARAAARDESQEIHGWAELVISDDGVGIPARQTRNLEIYEEPAAAEERRLIEALETRESIKLVTRDAVTIGEPGYGYTIIAGALSNLGAHCALRTGRRLAELDGTLPDVDGFRLRDEILGWLPGTVLHVVIPLRDPQLRIDS